MPELKAEGGVLDNWLVQRNVGYSLPGSNVHVKFNHMEEYVTFIDNEIQFWSQLGSNNEIYKRYLDIRQQLSLALNTQQHQSNAEGNLNNASNLFRPNTWPCILSGIPESQRCVELHKQNPSLAQPYFDHFKNRNFAVPTNPLTASYMTGLIDLLITQNAKTILRQATDSEATALVALRNSYIADQEKLRRELDEIRSEHKNRLDNFNSQFTSIQDDASTWQAEIDKWHQQAQKQYQEFLSKGREQLEHVKALFTEHMRFNGPATYWEEMQQFYEKRGRIWMVTASVLTVACVIFLTVLLYNILSWLFSVNSTNLMETIKGTVILGLIVSALAYLIRLFVRLGISAYHLSRDAKERRQLTSVYPALMNEKSMDETDRGIVLQALFSRADTGLLKGDASPAMPDATSLLSTMRNLTK